MAAVGIRVADVLDDAEFTALEEFVHGRARRMEAEGVAEAKGLVFRDADGRAEPVVIGVLERNDGVEAVVAAGELNDHEDAIGPADALGVSIRLGGHRTGAAIKE